jgi:hypothetical protein
MEHFLFYFYFIFFFKVQFRHQKKAMKPKSFVCKRVDGMKVQTMLFHQSLKKWKTKIVENAQDAMQQLATYHGN